MNRINVETNSELNESNTAQKEEGKIQQSSILFILCTISTLGLSYQNFVFFYTNDFMAQMITIITVIVATCKVYFLTSCKMAPNCCQILHLYILLDNIFVALMAAILGLIGIIIIITPSGAAQSLYILVGFMSLNLFVYAGTMRVLLAYCLWKKWQVIVKKFTIISCCFAYLLLASIVIIQGFPEGMIDDTRQESLKQFFFIYAFGLFTLYIEIYSKITELDGTNEFKHSYEIIEDQEKQNEKKKELQRKKLIKQFETNQTQQMQQMKQTTLITTNKQLQEIPAIQETLQD